MERGRKKPSLSFFLSGLAHSDLGFSPLLKANTHSQEVLGWMIQHLLMKRQIDCQVQCLSWKTKMTHFFSVFAFLYAVIGIFSPFCLTDASS